MMRKGVASDVDLFHLLGPGEYFKPSDFSRKISPTSGYFRHQFANSSIIEEILPKA